MSQRTTGGRLVDLLMATFMGWRRDDAGLLGAGLAYYGMLALAPLLLLVITVAGLSLGEQAAAMEVERTLVDVFGQQAAEGIAQMLHAVHMEEGTAFTNALSAGVLLYASTRLFAQIQMALHICWRISPAREDRFHRIAQNLVRRLAIFVIILAMALVLVGSVILQSTLERLEWLHAIPVDVAHTANNLVLASALIGGLTATFKWLPCAHVRLTDVWPGALVTAGLLMLGKAAMTLYLVRAADSSAYGIAGTTLVVILFLAYSAQIFLLGAKFTAVWIDDFGHGMTPRRGWMRVQRRAPALLDAAPADDAENPPPASEPPHPVEASRPEHEGSVGPDRASQPPS